ncbi:MAG: exopolysaccharide biosynthesis polyprenyl glycosylphosphotransferase [Oceanicoccus sp.]|jgi:exopolysaccharide biosynthesis polyprenyl glycosylphosphotransferase
MKRSEIAFGLVKLPLDFGLTVLSFYWGYHLRTQGDFIPKIQLPLNLDTFPPLNEYMELSLLFAGFLVIVFALNGVYKLKTTDSFLHEIRRVFSCSGVWLLVLMSYFFVVHEVFFSRLVLGFSVGITVILLVSMRLILKEFQNMLLRANIGKQRVLLIGSNKITIKLAKKLEKDPRYKVVGYLTRGSKKIADLKRLGTLKDLERITRKYQVDEIIQTSQVFSEIQDHDILEYCQANHLDYRFVPDILAVERSNIEIIPLAGFPLIHLKPTRLDGWGKVSKRVMDIGISSSALILLSPLLLLISIGIKFDSKGPVLFCRLPDGSPANRIGQAGSKFQFYKFRTMKDNSHDLRYTELAHKNHRKGSPLVKIKNDPRVTKFGNFLRRSSFDEFPQLWNVLRGDMSLVGPRPHLPEEVAKYEKHHKFLLTIKPGITGLSQTSGRSDLDFEEEVRLDSYYIKHWSLFQDLRILVKTVFVVLGGKAAD